MFSILIPVYNQSVVSLVESLQKQCEDSGVPFQIMVFDDKSDENSRSANASLQSMFGVNYVELSENLGRAKIRNRLARMAQYDWLIFMDGDSAVISDDYVQKYIQTMKKEYVVYGGRQYQKEKPGKDFLLHWKYGKELEALPVHKRTKNPYLSFQSNNFMINAKLFDEIQFDTDVKGYGYEDLLFAEEIRNKGLAIAHIDNPILHDGLESTDDFLRKTKNAVKNLVELNKEGKLKNVRLTKFYSKAKLNGYLPLIMKYINWREKSILVNLKSQNPSMRGFSLFKLLEYVRSKN